MSNYPAQIDTTTNLPTVVDNLTPMNGAVVNRLRDAIIATQAELGVKPSGTYGTVRARLDALEGLVGTVTTIQLAQDLGGSLSSPLVIGIQCNPISSTTPTLDQMLVWSGAAWVPSTVGIDESSGSSDGYKIIRTDGYGRLDSSFLIGNEATLSAWGIIGCTASTAFISNAFNVSSVTRLGIGLVQINLDTDADNKYYSVTTTPLIDNGNITIINQAVGYFIIQRTNSAGAAIDAPFSFQLASRSTYTSGISFTTGLAI
jgi:hypothetical protein